MRHKSINHVVHEWIVPYLQNNQIIIDATCGHGFDTKFLSDQNVHIFAFDIQIEAIEYTKELLKEYDHVTFIHDSHVHLDRYLTYCEGIVFNCGYLPRSDKKVITRPESTLEAMNKALNLLPKDGWMCVTFYQGHDGGAEEMKLGIQWMRDHLNIVHEYTYENVNNPPVALFGLKK